MDGGDIGALFVGLVMFKFFKKKKALKEFRYLCSECGVEHSGSPSFSHLYPPHYFDVPEGLRDEYVVVDTDFCYIKPYPDGLIENPSWFIRVVLDVPIIDAQEPFTWGVWVSQSKESAEAYMDGFGTDQTDFHSFGWLTLNLPYYQSYDDNGHLQAVPCNVRGGTKGQRPKIFIQECDHQLFLDQNSGLSWNKAIEIAELCMHS